MKYALTLASSAICCLMVLAGPAQAFHSIQNQGRGFVSLHAVDKDLPEQAHGTAKFRLKRRASGFYDLTVKVKVRTLHKRAGRVFEAWLVDKETGYALSLGTFNTNNTGNCGFSISRPITNLAQFNRLIITSEKTDDFDPTPNGPVLLEGKKS